MNEQLANANRTVAERNAQIANLGRMVAERDGQITMLLEETARILNSRSWKVTKPLRFLRRKSGDLLRGRAGRCGFHVNRPVRCTEIETSFAIAVADGY
jgi:hypothetical protein